MGICKAAMPDGSFAYKELSSAHTYRCGLARWNPLKGGWALLSVHRHESTATRNLHLLARAFSVDKAFDAETCLMVVPIVPIEAGDTENQPQSSTTLNGLLTA